MNHLFQTEATSKIPSILAEFLEAPVDEFTISKPNGGSHIDLVVKVRDRTFAIEFKSSSERAQLLSASMQLKALTKNAGRNLIPLVVVPYMGETGRRFCEERGLVWFDLSGNAHIKAPGLLIHVEGRPNRFRSAGRPRSVFAPKSSRITRQLLIEPYRAVTQRELSQETGLDEGQTSRVVRRLEQDKLIIRDERGAIRATDPSQLLDAWREVYDFSRHNIIKGHIAARSGDELLRHIANVLDQNKIDHAATGLGAAWLYSHFSVFRVTSFYLRPVPSEDLLGLLHFRLEPRGANTWFVVPNDEGVFHGTAVREGVLCVHPVQIYLDLKGHPERASEAASRLRQDYLAWRQDE